MDVNLSWAIMKLALFVAIICIVAGLIALWNINRRMNEMERKHGKFEQTIQDGIKKLSDKLEELGKPIAAAEQNVKLSKAALIDTKDVAKSLAEMFDDGTNASKQPKTSSEGTGTEAVAIKTGGPKEGMGQPGSGQVIEKTEGGSEKVKTQGGENVKEEKENPKTDTKMPKEEPLLLPGLSQKPKSSWK